MSASPQTSFQSLTWHAQSVDEVLDKLSVQASDGLTHEEAARRLEEHGPNALPQYKRRSPWRRFALQFHNPLIYVLLGAAAATFFMQDYVDAWVIVGVVFINAIIGFIQEGKAQKALEAVHAMLASNATVLRSGKRHEIDSKSLVPGDIVLLESGMKVPADLRLLSTRNFTVSEAALTGESLPVEKSTAPVDANASLGDRTCLVYSGTVVSFGQAQGVVVSTGRQTEIGRIGSLVKDIPTLTTPLTRRLNQFARQTTLFVLGAGTITFVYGHFIRKMTFQEIFLPVVGMAVAAIPEGLPAVVTIVLAIGTRAMARNNAIVRLLPAVETLGSVTVICSDKTGTLTRNEMTAVQVMLPTRSLAVSGVGYGPEGAFHLGDTTVAPDKDQELQDLALCAMLCNDARLQHDEETGWQIIGDPTEGALLTLAHKAGLDHLKTVEAMPRLDEIPFESEHRFMATLHQDHEGHSLVLLKGAPERVFDFCKHGENIESMNHADWQVRMQEAAQSGQRILALARRDMPSGTSTISMKDIDRRFTLLGLVGIIDPPREEAIAAIADCHRAGLRVKMITGDHVVTAAAIGHQLGLQVESTLTGQVIESLDDMALRRRALETDVFARTSPEHKLRLVHALQAEGELVAMTGDGVNDAPALRAANIGVAMGQKGTDAAREAADLVLTDDNFSTIAQAVREGRVVFDNIKKSLLFMLPTNGGEAGVLLLAIFAGLELPVTAAQILWVNTVTAVTLALALAFEPSEPDIMDRLPRKPTEPLITRLMVVRIAYVSLLMVITTFALFEWELARGNSIEVARTAAVNMLVIGELVYLFNVRFFTASAFSRDILSGNRIALYMAMLLIGFQLLFTYVPTMHAMFHTAAIDSASWSIIVVFGLAIFIAVEVKKALMRRRGIYSI